MVVLNYVAQPQKQLGDKNASSSPQPGQQR